MAHSQHVRERRGFSRSYRWGWFYAAYNFSAAEHGGTHMDAPIHFAEGANTTDQVPVDQMIGPGFVIDVSAQAGDAVDYLITAADIEAFEALHGPLPAGAIVLLNTGRSGLYFPQSGLKPPTLVGKTFKRAPKALMNH